MCGHAVISLGRYAVDYGLVPPVSPTTSLTIQCPCGPVKVDVDYQNGVSGSVAFNSVPSFVEAFDQTVDDPLVGVVHYDLVYGGAYYAMVDAESVGIDLVKTPISRCVEVAGSITDELRKTITITHPCSPDLAFVYGTILTTNEGDTIKQVCFFAERQVSSLFITCLILVEFYYNSCSTDLHVSVWGAG